VTPPLSEKHIAAGLAGAGDEAGAGVDGRSA